MSHSFAAHLFLSNFNTTTVADDALVADSLVLAAMTFVVFYRPKDPLAE